MENFIKLCYDVNCGDNFYNFVNSNWIDETDIPDGYSKWNVFQMLQKNNTYKIKNLLDELKLTTNKNYNKLNIIYSQYLNYEKRSEPSNILYIQQKIKYISLINIVIVFNYKFSFFEI